jgi:hypothetical protein
MLIPNEVHIRQQLSNLERLAIEARGREAFDVFVERIKPRIDALSSGDEQVHKMTTEGLRELWGTVWSFPPDHLDVSRQANILVRLMSLRRRGRPAETTTSGPHTPVGTTLAPGG